MQLRCQGHSDKFDFVEVSCPGQLRCQGQDFSDIFLLRRHLSGAVALPGTTVFREIQRFVVRVCECFVFFVFFV